MRKFARNDVIAELEKEYQNDGGRLLPLSSIDDNKVVRSVRPSKSSTEHFAKGISERGLYNPLVVRPSYGRYELILGRKRYYGARLAGLSEVPCVITEKDDEETLLMLLADIRDQKDSNVVEMALVYQALSREFGYSQQTLSSLSHASRSQVTNILRLLKLPEPVLRMIADGKLTYGHARSLVPLAYNDCLDLAEMAAGRGLSVRETEERAKSLLNPGEELNDLGRLARSVGALSIEEGVTHIVFDFSSEKKKSDFLKLLGKLSSD